MTGRDRYGVIINLLQYATALVALGWVLTQVDWARAGHLLSDLSWRTVLLVICVTIIGLVFRSDLWFALLEPYSSITILRAVRIDLTVNFLNQFLPSRISGRAAAPFLLRHWTATKTEAAVAIAGANTALYAILYGVVTVGTAVTVVGTLSPAVILLVVVSGIAYLVVGSLLILSGLRAPLVEQMGAALDAGLERLPIGTWTTGTFEERLGQLAETTTEEFRALMSNRRAVLRYTTGWVIAVVLAPGARVWLLLSGFGIEFQPVLLLPLYLVMSYSVTILPLTPGGIGISELTTTLVLVALGIPESVAAPVVFVDRLVGVYLPALVGAYPAARIDLSELAS